MSSSSPGDGLSVNYDTLRDLAATLTQISSQLNEVSNSNEVANDLLTMVGGGWNWSFDVLPPGNRFNDSVFSNAGNELNNYISNWSNAISKISTQTQTLSKALNDAASTYQGTDQSMAQALDTSGSTSGSTSS